MSQNIYENNPLHGVSAETMLNELVEFYGWDVLYAVLELKCFKINPSISSSLILMKKNEWARIKVEHFYLHRFKRMPAPVTDEEEEIKPRERVFTAGVTPGKPEVIKLEEEDEPIAPKPAASKDGWRSIDPRY